MKQRLFYALLFVIASFTISFAQEEDPPNVNWVRYYESMDMMGHYHWVNDIFAIPGGGYVLGGYVITAINTHAAWLLVTNGGGQIAADSRFNYMEEDVAFVHCYSVIKTDDGGYLMGGRTMLRDGVINFDVIKADANGQRQWWSVFGEGSGWGCHALIELKGGNFVAAGQSCNYQAFAVMVDENGNAIWENTYDGTWLFGLREVAGDGLLFAGYAGGGTALLIKTDYDGEVIWSNSFHGGGLWCLISCPEGGFAASGAAAGGEGFYLCRVDNDGDLRWDQNYEDFNPRGIAVGLSEMADGGFVLSGNIQSDQGHDFSATIRTDGQGNERWRRIEDSLPHHFNRASAVNYGSVVVKPDGSIVYGGNTQRIDEFQEMRNEGVIVCLEADRSAPHIVEFHPDTLFLRVLRGDSLLFEVRAEDLQDDSLLFVWTLDNEEVSTDSSAVVTFEESGLSSVKCVVSDGALADSVMWRVEVKDFFIRSSFPEGHELAVRRNSVYNFGLDVAVIDGLELFYTWTFTGRDRRQLVIGREDSVSVHFPLTGDNQLDVSVQGGEETEDIIWDIQVRSCLWWWWPHDLEMTVPQDTLMDFVVFPFNPESDSMRYRWEMDGEFIVDVESEIELTLAQIGEHVVTACVSEGAEFDTVQWTVTVMPPDAISGNASNVPGHAELFPPSPNPFNSTLNISWYVPVTQEVNLAIYDLAGRTAEVLVQQTVPAGEHRITFDARDLPSGYYLLRFECDGKTDTEKILLLR